jgi:very-short-patch-repair endonuclease
MSKGDGELENLIKFIIAILVLAIFGVFLKFKEQLLFYSRIFLIIVLVGVGIVALVWIFLNVKLYFWKKKNDEDILNNKNKGKDEEVSAPQVIEKNYCDRCKIEISKEVNDYSQKHFYKSLCKEHQPTKEAGELGYLLKKYYGWDIEFEKFDNHKHIDIAVDKAKTYIEVDGQQHMRNKNQALTDLKRDFFSFKGQFITIRITNNLVRDYLSRKETARYINKHLKERCSQLSHIS